MIALAPMSFQPLRAGVARQLSHLLAELENVNCCRVLGACCEWLGNMSELILGQTPWFSGSFECSR